MLHYETIDPETLSLLRKLQQIKEFSELRLVGGTSLALQLGHRKSVDLDLFGLLKTDKYELDDILKTVGTVDILKTGKYLNIFLINEIQVSIVNYTYSWLEEVLIEDNLPLAKTRDLAAMKLDTITGQGSMKDFIDFYFLLQHYSFKEMMAFYKEKYSYGGEFLVLKSLSYFDDADEEESPEMLIPVDWGQVKEKIIECVKNY